MKIEQWMLEAAKEVRTNIQPDLLRVSKFNIVAFAKIIAKHAPQATSGLLNHQTGSKEENHR